MTFAPNGCGKHCHTSAAEARRAMARTVQRQHGGQRPKAYYCEACAAWHWGNDPFNRHGERRRRYQRETAEAIVPETAAGAGGPGGRAQ